MQPPPSSPPQWSPDGQWWWDGSRWRHRNETVAPPAPSYPTSPLPPGDPIPPGYAMPPVGIQMPPPISVQPSPGLRIFLLVVLAIAGLFAGVFFFAGLAAVTGGQNKTSDILLFAFFAALFATEVVAFIAVVTRARWSRIAAMVAGIAIALTCLGVVLAIPIWIAAARAPDLARKPA
jgi:hypothetical protein